ncbi:hydrophobic/amphiphilic exporter-1, HAE1 family [Chitinophaga costaii]|uniref:Hydrophobic/amphiphilic exporter-1, HAE1 family n=1 Tax=Chitinophaga costaii TaxID=1335309 RepID=A0A1C4FZC2_9BACT|nr:efflux RND transporter permease subunit [Chitinophaga costaii]PUZ20946.1 AcrB/AcrD/AcrF family protein [Chitinophaga costaii]SCC61236.1 hydrophobic/amphiphilic exporter-1, HAE1 family [Chitinophaga costaii]
MLRRFITRPVLATVISLILVILGVVGMTSLPITKFPDIAPPCVSVTTVYPGAGSDVIARSVAPPLEDAINGVEDMTYMTSTSSNDGTLTISVYFKLGVNPDQAAVNVQNRVSQATSQLPAEVVQYGITTVKQQNSTIMFLGIKATDTTYDETFLQNYAKINIVPELKRIHGVGQATVFGNKDYSMRIWLKPQIMASYGITPQEVAAAIQDQNLEAAPGRFGQSSDEAMEYAIKYKGKLNNPESYENIIIRAGTDGTVLKLKDVARVEFGAFNYTVGASFNKDKSVMMGIYQTAGSNANAIEIELQSKMKELSKSFPPGIAYEIPYSSKKSLDESIDQVVHTLIEAFILVFIVVFIFLQDFRSTLIPAIAVPVSIVGTFFFMQVFGFSINILTLFALVLAIGIVVDDAIVVVEAVHAKMEKRKLPARAATISAMSEITGAIISITLVMSAVFLPVGFMDGPTGVFYRQFALTLAIAILISAVNALTLSPALCALFLKDTHSHDDGDHPQKTGFGKRFFAGFNAGFNKLTNRYGLSVLFLISKKWIAFTGLALVCATLIYMAKTTPTGFIPDEDQGFLIATVTLQPGASLKRTTEAMEEGRAALSKYPFVKNVISISGLNLLTASTTSSAGVLMIQMKDLNDRGETKDINQIVGMLQGALGNIKEASFYVLSLPTVQGFGTTTGIDMVMQDRTAGSLDKFNQVTQSFLGELMKQPEVALAFTTFNTGYPQYEMEIDEMKVKQLGVNVKDLITVMQGYYGSMQASDFNRFGKYYRVMLQSAAEDRADLASLDGIAVSNKSGQMVPINTLIHMKKVYGTETIDHFNLFNSISVTVIPKPGFSTGQAIEAVNRVKAANLPTGYTTDWKGLTREEQSVGGKTAFIFILCLIFVYLLLSAQYESYILPFAVMLSIPTGLMGVFLGIKLGGVDNNIYVQVALIMLIGLLSKNAILIVEYAVQRRQAGKGLAASAIDASKARLRPIIMTSLAFIAGLLPLLRAVGPSALGNHSIGWAAVFGMLSGVVLGIFIIPVLFIVFQYIQESISGIPTQLEEDMQEHV